MNSKLSQAIAKIRELSEDRQEAAADLLFEFVEHPDGFPVLTPEQQAELDRRLDGNDIASEQEVQTFFARFKA